MLLDERPAAHGVVLGVLKARRVRVETLTVADIGKRRQRNALKSTVAGRMR